MNDMNDLHNVKHAFNIMLIVLGVCAGLVTIAIIIILIRGSRNHRAYIKRRETQRNQHRESLRTQETKLPSNPRQMPAYSNQSCLTTMPDIYRAEALKIEEYIRDFR